ncbi:uncharacterized protein ARB_00901 [Trichophyton benhamiae CBS 112371]|uniref:Uncharacterized protein n=1 Tax=Arthroderma benhamiae (strain ATCC MYA-4681 / CBS 112371) TaxID=663331 RepID=D4AXI3_ARTBC|nr:uncharacterized protein ARB_00901 [Trichophyton benhamiae CBS 112371]EFE32011.1 conserved hypothetical protein [Trichophyton benhamiae CBS 112371]
MPIKIPGFGRRKSGPVLDETPPPEPSFRVFERPPHRASHSFDSVSALKKAAAADDPDPDNIFAGIQKPAPASSSTSHVPGTAVSSRTGKLAGSSNGSSSKPYDSSSASSARYSSSSTLPSSTDHSPHDAIPVPPIPESPFSFSIRASGRTFSFGSKASKTSTPRKSESTNRERAMTNSTTSTATPPKLMETDLSLEGSGEMGNIFEGVGVDKRRSRVLENIPTNIPQPGRPAPSVPAKDKRVVSPSPLSPLSSNHSRNSRDSLIAADDFALSQKLASQLQNVELNESSPNNARATTAAASSMPNSRSTPNIYSSTDRDRFRDLRDRDRDPEVSSLFSSDKDFSAVPRQPYHSSSSFRKNIPPSASMNSHYASSLASSKTGNKVMTPAQFERYQQQQAQRAPSEPSSDEEDEIESEDDEDETEKRKQAAAQRQKQEAHLSVYRQQMMKITGEQKKASTNGPAGSAESVAGNPNRRSVLDPMEVANSNNNNNTNNNLNINTASSSPGVSPGLPPGVGLSKSSPSDGEEDDDVPLGILAAHGFPHRNRPPTHLAASRSNPNLNASFQAGAASIAGMQEGPSKRSTLPVFARNLPKDPYYGSSLVNPSHRESLALGGGAPGVNLNTVNLGPPGLPPGGLVGVIASEERARAMRRGSPNAQGVYDLSPAPQVHTNFLAPQPQMQMGGLLGQLQQHQQAQAGMVSGMNTNGLIGGAGTINPHHHHHPYPQPGSVGGPADQTQMQVSQQMTNMMQMQMQWMQQMMQMQGAQQQQPPPPGGPMPNLNMNASSASLLQPPNPNQRPFSMASTSTPSQFRGPPQVDHRTLSMLDPSTASAYQNPGNRASFLMTPDMSGPSLGMGMGMGMGMGGGLGSGPAPGYTPSVAPSERSNIGAASRYRPVSTIAPQANGTNRSSTFTGHTLRPWAEERPPPLGQILANKSNTNLSATTPSTSETTPTVRPVSSINRRASPMGLGNGSRGSIAGLPTTPGTGEEDEDDEQGWAEMMKNREKKKTGWKFRRGGASGHDGSLGDYVHPTAI